MCLLSVMTPSMVALHFPLLHWSAGISAARHLSREEEHDVQSSKHDQRRTQNKATHIHFFSKLTKLGWYECHSYSGIFDALDFKVLKLCLCTALEHSELMTIEYWRSVLFCKPQTLELLCLSSKYTPSPKGPLIFNTRWDMLHQIFQLPKMPTVFMILSGRRKTAMLVRLSCHGQLAHALKQE